jgi:hypothetical protein
MDPTIPWYQSAIVRQQIVQIVVALTALVGVNLGDFKVDETLTSIFAGIAGLVGVWTLVTRIFKPAPNLSQTAVNKEIEMVADRKIPPSPTGKQSGFFRLSLAVFVGLFALSVISLLPGCAGTSAAYKAAQGLPDTAYVVAEHYAAVVKEAADLAAIPTTSPEVKEAMKAAAEATAPYVLGDPATGKPSLRQLAENYSAVKDAKTEAELQTALNSAVTQLARLINAVKAARR